MYNPCRESFWGAADKLAGDLAAIWQDGPDAADHRPDSVAFQQTLAVGAGAADADWP